MTGGFLLCVEQILIKSKHLHLVNIIQQLKCLIFTLGLDLGKILEPQNCVFYDPNENKLITSTNLETPSIQSFTILLLKALMKIISQFKL